MPDTPMPVRLLILDDDEVMRDLLEALLSADGFALSLASSGPEAVARLQGGLAVEAVLTDLQMPGLSGAALAGILREAMPAGGLLLGMSGSAPEPAARAALDGFLLKPFDAQALRAALRTAAQEVRSPRATQSSADLPAEEPVEDAGDSAGPVLNDAIVDSLRSMIPAEKLRELYEMTIADILQRHERMQAALAAGDVVTVKQEAHATKGSCGMVGAQQLQLIAAGIEEGTRLTTEEIGKIPEACIRLRRMLTGKLK